MDTVPLVNRRYADLVLAAVVSALYLVEIWTETGFRGDRGVSTVAALVFCASLAVRRRAPLVPLLAGVGVIELSNLAAPALANTATFLVGFAIAAYSAGRYARGWWTWAMIATIAVAIPLAAIEPGQPFSVSDAAYIVIFFAGPFGVGRVIRFRGEREQDLELERDAAVDVERARIARELHDVVAHAISVIVLQARGGRRVLVEDPDAALGAFDTIEHAGEQALSEMRRLLGILRQSDEALALSPQPTVARIGELAEGLRASGLPVEIVVEGEQRDLPPGVDVSAYRIVQEALTNALKHAGPARARVTLRYSASALEVEIVDDGAGTTNGGGSGHGLRGIQERVAVYGGELETGRRPQGGFAVRVRLPFEAAS